LNRRQSRLVTLSAALLALGLMIPAKGVPAPDADHPYPSPFRGFYGTAPRAYISTTQAAAGVAFVLGGIVVFVIAWRRK
jgi:hypothetical protein